MQIAREVRAKNLSPARDAVNNVLPVVFYVAISRFTLRCAASKVLHRVLAQLRVSQRLAQPPNPQVPGRTGMRGPRLLSPRLSKNCRLPGTAVSAGSHLAPWPKRPARKEPHCGRAAAAKALARKTRAAAGRAPCARSLTRPCSSPAAPAAARPERSPRPSLCITSAASSAALARALSPALSRAPFGALSRASYRAPFPRRPAPSGRWEPNNRPVSPSPTCQRRDRRHLNPR